MTESEVGRIFDGVALPHEVKPVVEVVLTTTAAGGHRGYGFIELATSVQAERAKTMLDGRAVSYGGRMPTTLQVRTATRPKGSGVRAPPIAGRQLWVGNISFDARPAALRDAFADAAGVSDRKAVWCTIARDHATRKPAGYGTVRFPDPQSARRALEAMRGSVYEGRQLLVQLDNRHDAVGFGSSATAAAAAAEAASSSGARATADASAAASDGQTGLGQQQQRERGQQQQQQQRGQQRASVSPAAAADDIDPELLASVEGRMLDEEKALRRLQEIQRQHDIHEHYLRSVADAQAEIDGDVASAGRTGKLKRKRARAVVRPSSGKRIFLTNLPFSERAYRQRRALTELLETSDDLAADPFNGRPAQAEVWVGADRFGLSRGIGIVSARSLDSALKAVEVLNGTQFGGRTLHARLEIEEVGDKAMAMARSGTLLCLPRFRPLWLARTASGTAAAQTPPPADGPDPYRRTQTTQPLPPTQTAQDYLASTASTAASSPEGSAEDPIAASDTRERFGPFEGLVDKVQTIADKVADTEILYVQPRGKQLPPQSKSSVAADCDTDDEEGCDDDDDDAPPPRRRPSTRSPESYGKAW